MATSTDVLTILKSWIGKKESDGSFKTIIDTYNKHTPLAQNYKVKYTDEWCAATVSAAFIKAGAVDAIGGTECSVQRFINIFKKKGIWNEDGRITPRPGDIICYNWDDGTQPNDGWADHIGVVEKVSGKTITVIEGNMSNGAVGRRTLTVGWGYIRGYARPRYTEEKPADKPTIYLQAYRNGSWGKRLAGEIVGKRGFNLKALRCNAVNKTGKPFVALRVGKIGDTGYFNWQYDLTVDKNGENFAGDKKSNFDRLQMDLRGCPGWQIKYRVFVKGKGWLPWVIGYNNSNTDGYAGIIGLPIQMVEVKVVKVA